MSEDVLNIDDEAVDPSFALDSSIKSVVDHLLSNFFVKNGFLTSRQKAECPVFKHSDFGKTKAAELASMKVGRSNKTVHEFHCELT